MDPRPKSIAASRQLTLILRAQARGIIDCREARLLDRTWWIRLAILLRTMQAEIDHEERELLYRFYLAQLANSALEADSFNQSQESAIEILNALQASLRPWRQAESSGTFTGDRSNLVSEYNRVIGDPTTPEGQQRTREIVEHLRALRARVQNEAQTEDTLVSRLRQRDQQRRQRLHAAQIRRRK